MTPEERLQIDVVDFLRLAAPDLLFFHVPNQSKSKVQYRKKLKSMGVLAGVPDLMFILHGGRVAYIELKTAKGVLSKAQRDFRDRCTGYGCCWALARSVAEVEGILRQWNVYLKATVAA